MDFACLVFSSHVKYGTNSTNLEMSVQPNCSQTVQQRKTKKVGLACFGNAKGRVGASLKVSPLSNHVAVKNFRVWVPICKDFGWVAKQNNQNCNDECVYNIHTRTFLLSVNDVILISIYRTRR